jgi:hypothetical protein
VSPDELQCSRPTSPEHQQQQQQSQQGAQSLPAAASGLSQDSSCRPAAAAADALFGFHRLNSSSACCSGSSMKDLLIARTSSHIRGHSRRSSSGSPPRGTRLSAASSAPHEVAMSPQPAAAACVSAAGDAGSAVDEPRASATPRVPWLSPTGELVAPQVSSCLALLALPLKYATCMHQG